MNLLIDIGNTRIKWGLEVNGVIEGQACIVHNIDDLSQQIKKHWMFLESPELIAISSVSSEKVKELLIGVAKKNWPDIQVFIAQSSNQACSVTNAYQNPEKLGIDRWLGLIALHHYYPNLKCVVDCGTAITIDCIANNGIHLGGLISPGVQLMQESLTQGTENLKDLTQKNPLGLASNTASAIYSGIMFSAAGLIDKAIDELCQSDVIVITGGNAGMIAGLLKVNVIIETDFILKGLALLVNEERKQ